MKVHFIAIGGSAMHNLAIALSKKNYEVTGSDDHIFEPSKSRLAKYGLLPAKEGWYPEKISTDLDAIVLGMHAREDNPELLKAMELGLKIYSYPEFLYEQSKNKKRVVIGGSHGKTTTTAMILHILEVAGKKFDYMVGAKLEGFEVMVQLSEDADIIVLEGDEYLSSPIDRRPKFHLYQPNIAVITGIAWDHVNVFPTYENYCEQFSKFVDLIEEDGSLIYFSEDKDICRIVKENQSNIKKLPYQVLEHKINDGVTEVKLNKNLLPLKVFGKHNLENMNAAIHVCRELGVKEEVIEEAIQSFGGASNRLEEIASSQDIKVFKDFAHAPSKLKATINAVKQQFEDKELIACMELHTFSSLNKAFLHHYEGAMNAADLAIVYFNPDVVKHKRLPEITTEDVMKAFGNKNLVVMTESEVLKDYLLKQKKSNQIYLLMSSGNYDGIHIESFGEELTSVK